MGQMTSTAEWAEACQMARAQRDALQARVTELELRLQSAEIDVDDLRQERSRLQHLVRALREARSALIADRDGQRRGWAALQARVTELERDLAGWVQAHQAVSGMLTGREVAHADLLRALDVPEGCDPVTYAGMCRELVEAVERYVEDGWAIERTDVLDAIDALDEARNPAPAPVPAPVPPSEGWWWADMPDVGATPVEVVECGCTDDVCLTTEEGEALDELAWLTDPDGACVPCVPPESEPEPEPEPCPPPEVGQVWELTHRHTVADTTEHRGEILVAWDIGNGITIRTYTSLAEWREYGRASRLLSPDGDVLWTGPDWQGGDDV